MAPPARTPSWRCVRRPEREKTIIWRVPGAGQHCRLNICWLWQIWEEQGSPGVSQRPQPVIVLLTCSIKSSWSNSPDHKYPICSYHQQKSQLMTKLILLVAQLDDLCIDHWLFVLLISLVSPERGGTAMYWSWPAVSKRPSSKLLPATLIAAT